MSFFLCPCEYLLRLFIMDLRDFFRYPGYKSPVGKMIFILILILCLFTFSMVSKIWHFDLVQYAYF